MKAEDIVDGMRAVLTEPFLDTEGFRMGDVVTVEISDSLNLDSWVDCVKLSKMNLPRKGYDDRLVVYVKDAQGTKQMCFIHRLDPATNVQMELFE